MLYLDTHVVVWLYAGDIARFPPNAVSLMEMSDLLISPIVLLELQYLREIGRLVVEPAIIYENLSSTIGLGLCGENFRRIVFEAMTQSWTRDPFDRIMAAHAIATDSRLLTKDQSILANCSKACWD